MAEFLVNPNLKTPKYSVIMLIFHRTDKLVDIAQECWDSVLSTVNRDETELIIVDNGSQTRHDWESQCDTYVRLNANLGISRGWNTGLKLARANLKVIIGDDVKVRPGWLEAMAEGMAQPNAGMCNPYMQHLPFLGGLVENYKWPSGACFMLSQNTIDKVGYFAQEDYFPANHEDWDYWTRIYKAGLKIYTNYSVMVQHREGQTVHDEDIAVRSPVTRQAYLDKWHFDPTPVFCGDVSIYTALGIPES